MAGSGLSVDVQTDGNEHDVRNQPNSDQKPNRHGPSLTVGISKSPTENLDESFESGRLFRFGIAALMHRNAGFAGETEAARMRY
jgi:hypothetical protein